MQLTSTAFDDHGPIPRSFTGEGQDRSPPLAIADVPNQAKSLALIVDDPDAPDPAAPKRTWVHWVMYNLAPTTKVLDEGVTRAPAPGRDGRNDWDKSGYGGPRPPVGKHRYFHKLYALDVVLPDLGTPTKATLEKAMQGHVIAEAELVGTYQKGG
jgi:Raf kinase inhibitor-like YbhB/YbcL family protein